MGTRESDWRRYRVLREPAFERFSERILAEIDAIRGDQGRPSGDRWRDILALLRRCDREEGS